MSLMRSVSGVRGIIGKTFTPEIVVKYVSIFTKILKGKKIAIGYDGRNSGKSFIEIVKSTLLLCGSEVFDIGISPTPTILFAVKNFSLDGGISLTASHNPIEWNGLKFISNRGMFLNKDEIEFFFNEVEKNNSYYSSWDNLGKIIDAKYFLEEHLKKILSLSFLEIEKIKVKKYKIVVDCINSSGNLIIPKLLQELGCEVIQINSQIGENFSHSPEPVPENLFELSQVVKKEKANIGFAIDPDSDRVAIIMENGFPFSEEYTVVACAKTVLRKVSPQQNVVVNLSTTQAIEDISNEFNANVFRTPVGEINVSQKMKEINSIVGGEGSGGIILPQLHFGRDGSLGVALFLQLLTEENCSVSELKEKFPKYFMKKAKFEIGNLNFENVKQKILEIFKNNSKINTEDGIRISFGTKWIHIRKSNTEPILRIIAESSFEDETFELIKQFQKIIFS